MRLSDEVKDAKGNVIVKKGRKVTNLVLRELQKAEVETLPPRLRISKARSRR
ncbi:MAG: hypothetical protein R2748_08385 [Bryobacterales bacterium]